MPDIDQVILRFLHALAAQKQLLKQLLAGTQAGVDDGDVHIRLKAGQPDHVARQIVDAHRIAHVEHENFSAVRIGAGLENELHRLRDRHEIPDHVLIRDCDRAAGLDLLAEQRNDAAGRAEHVAKPHRDILRRRAVVHHLHDHLADALGRAHDVRRVHSLVRRDENKPLRAELVGRLRDIVCAEHVVLDRLKRRRLHERHVLVRRRMANEVRAVLGKHVHHALPVAHGADQHDQIQLRMRALQLHLNIICIVFVNIKNDELLRVLRRSLTAKLAADAAAAARDEHDLILDIPGDLVQIDPHRVAAQQVFNIDLTDLLDIHLAVGDLVQTRQRAQAAAGLLADVQNVQPLLARGGRDGEDDLLHIVFPRSPRNIRRAADDAHAAQVAAALGRIVVNDADDLVFRMPAVGKLAHDHRAGMPAADEHCAFAALTVHPGTAAAQRAVRKPKHPAKQPQQQRIQDREAARHTDAQHKHAEHIQHRRNDRRGADADQLRGACKLPQAVIQLEQREHHDRHQRVDPRKGQHPLQEAGLHERGSVKLKPDIQRQKRRQIDE